MVGVGYMQQVLLVVDIVPPDMVVVREEELIVAAVHYQLRDLLKVRCGPGGWSPLLG